MTVRAVDDFLQHARLPAAVERINHDRVELLASAGLYLRKRLLWAEGFPV